MDDLVLVKKMSRAEMASNGTIGRPMRDGFCLRKYSDACIVVVPSRYVVEGHRADFYVSSSGFGLRTHPDGSRALSGKKSARVVSVPTDVRGMFDHIENGTYELSGSIVKDDIWFFPISQLPRSEAQK